MLKNSRTNIRAKALGFRSGFECDVADYLEGLGIKFVYEDPVHCCFNYLRPINKGKVVNSEWHITGPHGKDKVVQLCNYTVDFCIFTDKGKFFIETKGRFTAPDRMKHRLIKDQYPNADIRLLFQHDGKATPKMSYTQWCYKFGIKCGVIKPKTKTNPPKYLPDAWIEELQ